MNLVYLSYKNIISRPLSSFLSWLLLTFGICIVVMIIQASSRLEQEVTKNASGIDLVIGAKGSPLQIILSSIFHIDFPTGNIDLKEAYAFTQNRYVKQSVPLSLGDSYQGYRIVGTNKGYAELYGAELVEGEWFEDKHEAVVGFKAAKELGLEPGSKFQSQHGMDEQGEDHDHHFTVSGIMNETGTVIDDLLLVSLPSIWLVHGHEKRSGDNTIQLEKWGFEVYEEEYETEQITSLLIQFRSPMGAVMLPNQINQRDNLQAASPAYETSRLFNILGVGIKVMNVIGLVIIVISAISVFISLLNSLKERRYEIAIMRTIGAGRKTVFSAILLEGFLITISGILSGLIFGHLIIQFVFEQYAGSGSFMIPQNEWVLMIACVFIGILASLMPATMAYRTDISRTLSEA